MSARIYTPPGNVVVYDEGGFEQRLACTRWDSAWSKQPDVVAHLDAAESLFLERQLRHIIPQMLVTEYAEINARKIFPVYFANDPGAETYSYERVDERGEAEITTSYANQPPTAEVLTGEHPGKIRSLWSAAQWNIQEVRSAAKANRNLNERKTNAARDELLRLENRIAFHGDTDHGLNGLFLDPLIPREDADDLVVNNTPTENLAMLHEAANDIPAATEDIYKPDTLLIPPRAHDFLVTQRLGTNGEGPNVLATFLSDNPHVRNVIRVRELQGADSNGNDCMIAFRRNMETVRLMVFLDLEAWPIERTAGVFRQIYHMRTGGLCIHAPQAFRIIEGVG